MKLYAGGYLTFYMPQRKNTIEIQLGAPTSLKAVLLDLQIPLAEVHLVAINGDQVDLDEAIIAETDVVRIFSSVNGG
jgi:sulfur carrier protein ThiS